MAAVSPGDEGRIGIQISAQVPREQQRLEMEQKPDCYPLTEERMDNLLLLPFLIGDEDLTSVPRHA